MKAQRRWLIGPLAVAVVAMAVISLYVLMNDPPPGDIPVAAFTSVETDLEGTIDAEVIISRSTNASLLTVYMSVNGTNSWAHSLLTSSGAALVLDDGREFKVSHVDKNADGMVDNGDHIAITGPFDGDDYVISLVFGSGYATICSTTVQVS